MAVIGERDIAYRVGDPTAQLSRHSWRTRLTRIPSVIPMFRVDGVGFVSSVVDGIRLGGRLFSAA